MLEINGGLISRVGSPKSSCFHRFPVPGVHDSRREKSRKAGAGDRRESVYRDALRAKRTRGLLFAV